VQGSEDKDGGLAHSRLGLTKHIHSHDRLRDTFLLHFTGMFKTTVYDGLHELWSEKEIFESGGMDTCELQLLSNKARGLTFCNDKSHGGRIIPQNFKLTVRFWTPQSREIV
jgi:hypothetical protein